MFRPLLATSSAGPGPKWRPRTGAGVVALLLAAVASTAFESSEWMSVDGNVLELKLAHDEGRGPDGGVLRVDPTARTVVWRGIPGELGCTQIVDALFEDVRSIKLARGAGFVIAFRDRKSLTLLPVLHAPWFYHQSRVSETPAGFAEAMKEGLLKFPGGEYLPPNGDVGAAGPRVQQVALPEEVVADTRLALDSILQVLGRAPSPGLKVREALYGSPEDVEIPELSESPATFEGQAIRIRGRIVERPAAPGTFELDTQEKGVPIVPTKEIEMAFRAAVKGPGSDDVEITGVFHQLLRETPSGAGVDTIGAVTFWDFARVALEIKTPGPDLVPLERLVSDPGPFKGKTVRVVGKFRGHNLYTDLPPRHTNPSGFVIKDGRWALWITGKKPEGKGWKLDPLSPGDTENWLQVTGLVKVHAHFWSLRAEEISVTPPPSGQANVIQPRRLVGGGRLTPSVMFALPLPGEPTARNGLFVIQFNKYMDPRSFEGRVRVRYGTDDHVFQNMRISYDEDRRALVIDPGELLEAGREVEVMLLPGIIDSDGRALEAPPGDAEAVYRLRCGVASKATGEN